MLLPKFNRLAHFFGVVVPVIHADNAGESTGDVVEEFLDDGDGHSSEASPDANVRRRSCNTQPETPLTLSSCTLWGEVRQRPERDSGEEA